MSGWRKNHQRHYVRGKNKRRIVRTVEDKIKSMFGMLPYYALQRFEGKPADTFQFVF